MLSQPLQNSIAKIIEDIAQQGYAVIEHFLNAEEINALVIYAKTLQTSGEMHKAKTGVAKIETSSIRGDFIHWIEANQASSEERTYLNAMHELQQALNQAYFLCLFELESHFAIYPPGSGYQKHLDQFIGKQERKISSVLYLNNHWQSEDGGALRIYLDKNDEAKFVDILPKAGTLVVFLSADFLHEVLPAKRERMSIAGWFRTRALS
jgi:SM-20-related protein